MRRVMMAGLLVGSLLASLGRPAWADDDSDTGKKILVTGVVATVVGFSLVQDDEDDVGDHGIAGAALVGGGLLATVVGIVWSVMVNDFDDDEQESAGGMPGTHVFSIGGTF